MIAETKTLLQMAQSFAVADSEIGEIHRKLRHFDAHGLIKAAPLPRDGRGTSHFDLREMLIGRLLLAASDIDMTCRDLGWLRNVIDHGRTVVFPECGNYEISLDAIIPRIRGGENWLVELASARSTDAEARTTLSQWVRLRSDGHQLRFGAAPLSPGVLLGDGRPIETVTYIHATNLLLPLIATEA
ncbi:hypothetical protein [Brevundimonas sp. TWP2-3-4b2]|uniref:hypothetical protein n=1 Tax=Brevundimonas sp. TWP2-3-4b2 TaxID=2804595 RepID=UPI003CF6DC50